MAGEWAQRPHSLFPTEGDQKAPVWDSPALCHLSPTTHYYFCFRRSSDAAILLLFIVSCIWALPSYSLSAPYPASALHHLFHVVFLVGVEVEEVLPSCSHLPFYPARLR